MPMHPLHPGSPPPGSYDYLSPSHTPAPFAAPNVAPGMITPSSGPTSFSSRPDSGYTLHDDGPQDHDTIEEPLLQRPGMNMPGGPGMGMDEDPAIDTNIRYGHIPQRVPRRYKTIKKVE
jgi:chitin synthase